MSEEKNTQINEHDAASTPTTTEGKRRPHWLRRILITLGVLVLLLIVLVALAPTLVSTGPGTRFVLGFVNSDIPGHISVNKLSVGWFSPAEVEGLQIDGPDGAAIGSVKRIALARTTLASFNTSQLDVEVIEPNFKIVRGADGRTNLENAFSPPAPAPGSAAKGTPGPSGSQQQPAQAGQPFQWPENFGVRAVVTDARFSFAAPDAQTIEVQAPKVELTLQDPRDINAVADAVVRQAGQEGSINVDAKVKNLFGADRRLSLNTAEFDVHAKVDRLPMELIDQLANTRGKVVALIGPTLAAQVQAIGKLDNLSVQTQADAEHFNLDGRVVMTDAGIEVKETPGANLTITPDALAMLIDGARIAQPIQVQARVTRLSLPRAADGSVDIGQLAAAVEASVSDADITLPKLGVVTLRDAGAQVKTDALAKRVDATASVQAGVNQNTGSLKLAAAVNNLLAAGGKVDYARADVSLNASAASVPTAVVDELLSLDKLLTTSLGDVINASVDGRVASFDKRGLGSMQIAMTTPLLQVKTQAEITEQDIHLTPGELLTYHLTPQTLAQWMPKDEQGQPTINLARSTTIVLTLDQAKLPRAGGTFEFDRATVGLHGAVDRVQLAGVDAIKDVWLQAVTMQVPETRLSELVIARIEGRLVQADRSAALIDGEVRTLVPGLAPDAPAMPVKTADLRLQNVATPVVEALMGMTSDQLALAFGSTVDRAQVSLARAEPIGGETQRFNVTVDLSDQDPLLAAKIPVVIGVEPTMLSASLAEPTTISWRLTPEVFAAYMASMRDKSETAAPQWSLANTPKFAVNLSKLALRMPRGEAYTSLRDVKAAVDVRASVDAIEFKSADGPRVFARQVELAMQSADLVNQVHVELTGQAGQAPDATAQPALAKLQSNTDLTSYVASTGEFTGRAKINIATDTRLPDVPIALIDALTAGSDLKPIFGDAASIMAHGNFPGDMTVQLDSGNAKANAVVHLDQSHTLTLAQDLVATLQVNEELSKAYLQNIHPMFQDAVGSKEPLKFTLYSKDPASGEPMRIPLTDFDITKVTAAGRIDVTPLSMKRQGWMTEMFSGIFKGVAGGIGNLFGANKSRHLADGSAVFGERKTYVATFPDPLAFTLKNGVLTTRQFWLSAPDMAIGFEGVTNLGKDTRDFVIGIPGATLIAEDPVLFVPLPTSSFIKLGIEAQTIYNVGVKGSAKMPIASQINYVHLVSQIVTSAMNINAQRIGGEAGGGLVRGITGLVTGVSGAVSDTVIPGQKDSALRQVKWQPPESVQEFINSKSDHRQMLMLQQTKEGKANKEAQQQQQNNSGASDAPPADSSSSADPTEGPLRQLFGDLLRGNQQKQQKQEQQQQQ